MSSSKVMLGAARTETQREQKQLAMGIYFYGRVYNLCVCDFVLGSHLKSLHDGFANPRLPAFF